MGRVEGGDLGLELRVRAQNSGSETDAPIPPSFPRLGDRVETLGTTRFRTRTGPSPLGPPALGDPYL